MTAQYQTIKEYQAQIKKNFPFGVPWVTPYEAFCQHHYNFDVIAQEYGLKAVLGTNTRHLERMPSKSIIAPRKFINNDIIKGVNL